MADLIRDLPVRAPGPLPEVRGVSLDSRLVVPGDLFVAVAGERHDGRDYAADALGRGAVAVLGEGAAPAGLEGVWLEAEAPRSLAGELAARVTGHPDRELVMAGVTGTNGKSTVVALLAAMLDAAGRPAASIGTLGSRFRDREVESERTTPEAPELFARLRAFRDAGAEAVAMEVSSHALELGRVEGARFDVAVFLNLTRDHLDFHPDLEAYFAAKRRLFERLKPGGRAAVNVADPYGARLARELPEAVTFGPGGAVTWHRVAARLDGLAGVFRTPRGEIEFASPLVGEFNLENLAAAVAAAEALELAPRAIAAGIAATAPLPGRMEPVAAGQPFPAFVDYAHTEAALAAALESLARLGGPRIVVVFGCGGDRDRGKREPMGRVAGRLAERVILTSDNPRGEDPREILAAVARGVAASGAEVEIEPDRRQAIRRAVAAAGEGWALLVAGKGHERVQIVGERRIPFSDREELTTALEERFGRGTAE